MRTNQRGFIEIERPWDNDEIRQLPEHKRDLFCADCCCISLDPKYTPEINPATGHVEHGAECLNPDCSSNRSNLYPYYN